jgi:uncharacterized repeat protein (TIGR01451 family)
MRDVVYRFSIVGVFILVFFSILSGLVLAQEPTSLEISLVPQIEFAVAGQPFTYTVVVTNTGPATTENLIIFTQTPTGTTFARTGDAPNWFISKPGPGETGAIGWATRDPIAAGAVIKFNLVVNVLPNMVNQQLTSHQYGIASMGGSDLIASGSAVEVNVVAIPPTATPTATPTVTPIPTSTSMPTPTLLPIHEPAPTPTDSLAQPPAATPAVATETGNPSLGWIVGAGGLLIVLIVGAGVIWFFKQKRS